MIDLLVIIYAVGGGYVAAGALYALRQRSDRRHLIDHPLAWAAGLLWPVLIPSCWSVAIIRRAQAKGRKARQTP
jgi:hypothetical protein